MKKLNNEGWGFMMFFLFLLLFLIAILMISYLVNHFETGLTSQRDPDVSYSEYQVYKKYEKMIREASLDYVANHGDFSYININELGLNKSITSQCYGYVLSSGGDYRPYIHCNQYETVGFDEQYLYG